MDFIKEQIKKKRSYLNKSTRNITLFENLLVNKNQIQKISPKKGLKKSTPADECDKIYEALLASSQIDPQDFISCLKESQNSHLLPCFFKPAGAPTSATEQNESTKQNAKSPDKLPLFYLLIGSLTQLQEFTSFYPFDTNLLTTIKLKYTKVDCPLLQKCLQGCLALKSLLLDNIRISRTPSSSDRPHLPNIKEYLYSELVITRKKSKTSSLKKLKTNWQDYILFEVTKGEQLTFEGIKSKQINISVSTGEETLLVVDSDHQKLIINNKNESKLGFENLVMLFSTFRNICMRNIPIDIKLITHQTISNISDLTLHDLQISSKDFQSLLIIPNRIQTLSLDSCPQLKFDFADIPSSVRSLALHNIQGVHFTQSQPPKMLHLDSLLISDTLLDNTVQDMFSKALKCKRLVLGQHLKPQETALELKKNLVASNSPKAEWLLVWSLKYSTLEGIAHCLVPVLKFKKGHPTIFEINLSSNQLEERTSSEDESFEIISDMLGYSNFSKLIR